MNLIPQKLDAFLNKHHELARKIVHVGYGLFFIAIALLFGLHAVKVLSVIGFFIFLGARRFKIFPRMYDVYRTTYGELFYPAGLYLAAVISATTSIFVISALILALADSSASLFGKFIKSPKLITPYATASLAGSGTFLGVTLVILFAATELNIVEMTPSFALLLGFALTGSEAVSPIGSDNLFIPIIAANVLSML